MSALFAELYLDEDVDVLVATMLRARGFAATTTVEAGNLHASDAAQLAYAAEQGRALLTHNRDDFASLHTTYAEASRRHHGIVVAVRRPPHEIVARLFVILNRLTADEIADQIIFI